MKQALIIAMLAFSTSAFSQTVPAKKGITIDFMDLAHAPDYKKIIHNDSFFVIIKNINLNLYKVEGSIAQEAYNTEPPDVFSGIKLPGFLNLSLPATPTTMAGNINRTMLLPGGDTARENTRDLIKDQLRIIAAANEIFERTADLNNSITNLFNACGTAYTSIESALLGAGNLFLQPTAPIVKRDEQAKEIKQRLSSNIEGAVAAKKELAKLLPLHLYQVSSEQRQLENNIKDWEDNPPKPTVTHYAEKRLAYLNDKENLAQLVDYKDSIKAVVESAEAAADEMKKFADDNKINELVDNYNKINESNFTFYSDALKVKDDEVKVDLTITAQNPLPCNAARKVSLQNSYKVRGGWKVDFSTGIFFNGGSEEFLGQEFIYKPVDSSHKSIQAKDAGKRLMLSIGGLMHIYYRTGGFFNFAFSPGLSVPSSIDGLNFHLGLSAIFGRSERVVLTGGATIRDVNILDRNYKVNESYANDGLPDAPPTIKKFPETGWFISLTYNWSKLKKQDK